jgi:hypothetical protein
MTDCSRNFLGHVIASRRSPADASVVPSHASWLSGGQSWHGPVLRYPNPAGCPAPDALLVPAFRNIPTWLIRRKTCLRAETMAPTPEDLVESIHLSMQKVTPLLEFDHRVDSASADIPLKHFSGRVRHRPNCNWSDKTTERTAGGGLGWLTCPARTPAAPRGVYVPRAIPALPCAIFTRHFARPRAEFTCPAPSPRRPAPGRAEQYTPQIPARPRAMFTCPEPSPRGLRSGLPRHVYV